MCAQTPPSSNTASTDDWVTDNVAQAASTLARLLQARGGTCAVPVPGALVPDNYLARRPTPLLVGPTSILSSDSDGNLWNNKLQSFINADIEKSLRMVMILYSFELANII